MALNNHKETPLHFAAWSGHLDDVPRRFLTAESMTVSFDSHYTASGYLARSDTPLHCAVSSGHADHIPKEFLKPEYLSIPASGYRETVLHMLARCNRLDLVPAAYADSEMWNLQNCRLQTPRDVLAERLCQDEYREQVKRAAWRVEPATEKQKLKLQWFKCTWEEGLTKGLASDAIEECVRRFPEANAEYYDRPATEEQLTAIRAYLVDTGEELEDYADKTKPLTYGEAKDLLWDFESNENEKLRAMHADVLERFDAWATPDEIWRAAWIMEHTYEFPPKSEQAQIKYACGRLNKYWPGAFREVTHEEFAQVWALVKSRKPGKLGRSTPDELVKGLQEVFPEFKRKTITTVAVTNVRASRPPAKKKRAR